MMVDAWTFYSAQAQPVTPVAASPSGPVPTATVPTASETSRPNSAGNPGELPHNPRVV
jgi:hypothetical protein